MTPSPAPVPASLPEHIEAIAASVVALKTRHQSASGAVWNAGIVVSTATTLWRSSSATVMLPDGESVRGDVAGLDPATDLAVIRLPDTNVPVLERAAHPPSRTGDFAFAVGRSASGLAQASFGFVGATSSEWRTWRGGRVERLIRLDGGLYPGFEGAPVANGDGRVIGIASGALSRHHGVVLPVETVDRIVAQLLAHGHVPRGYLGIAAQSVEITVDGRSVEGLLVSSLAENGPAAKGGMKVADVIVQVGSTPVGTLGQLRDALEVGAQVPVRVARGDQTIDLSIEVAQRPGRRCG
jgi:serine protease Do